MNFNYPFYDKLNNILTYLKVFIKKVKLIFQQVFRNINLSSLVKNEIKVVSMNCKDFL